MSHRGPIVSTARGEQELLLGKPLQPSAQATLTKCHRRVAYTTEMILPHFWRWNSKIKVAAGSALCESCLLALSSGGLSLCMVKLCVPSSSHNTSPIRLESPPCLSLTTSLKILRANIVTLGVKVSTHEFGEGHSSVPGSPQDIIR